MSAASPAGVLAAPPASPAEPGGAARVGVVIASPDPTLRLQLRRLLPIATGCDIVGSARFGANFAEALEHHRPDALVVDGRCDVPGAAEVLAQAHRKVARVVLLHGAVRDPSLHCGHALTCPADLAREPGQSEFARTLAGVLLTAPTRSQRPLPPPPAAPVLLQGLPLPRPEVLAFGCSTGGPPALLEVFRALARRISQPIIVTQHMPPRFTAMLAQQLSQTGVPTHEAEQNMPMQSGHAYVAPGGQHLTLHRRAGQLVCALYDGPPENFCKPSVDVMLRSVAQVCGGKALAVILTGMGQDGLLGARDLVAAGGAVVAQDERSSVVWGMPGAVAGAGLCRAVVPLAEIPGTITSMVGA